MAVLAFDFGEELIDGGGIGYVGGGGMRLPAVFAQFIHAMFDGGGGKIVDENSCACGGEPLCNGAPDAASSSGDKGDFV